MSDVKPYKLLIKATLVQQSAFSTGGNRYKENHINLDHVLAKNGNGIYTLRGTGLAGAFIATARKLYADLPNDISEDTPTEQGIKLRTAFKVSHQKDYGQWLQDQDRMKESLFIFHNMHPSEDMPIDTEIRDNVAIRQKTGAAKDGAKFDSETLPAGTSWDFLMEVDQYRDKKNIVAADSIALNVIKFWQDNGCRLGKDVARGLGLMKLENLQVYQLTNNHVCEWPNSEEAPLKALEKLDSEKQNDNDIREISNRKLGHLPDFISGSITIKVSHNEGDGYGLDMLSVGGNNSKDNDIKIDYPKYLQKKKFLLKHREKLLKPQGQIEDEYLSFSQNSDNDIDFSIATTKTADGSLIPYIPGSSIRGSMRHVLSWLLRKDDLKIWESGGENKHPNDNALDIVLKIFGSTKHSANLLISDAMPVNDNWQAVVLEMHAEDEFTQSAYDSSKFDRTCLTKGEFKAHFLLEAKNRTELCNMQNELDKLQTMGRNHMIPIGGGQWKGLGWVKLQLKYTQENCTETTEESSNAAALNPEVTGEQK